MSDREIVSFENKTLGRIASSLATLESLGELAVLSSNSDVAAKGIYDAIKELMPSEKLKLSESMGLRAFVLHTIYDERFLNWEIPVLTGFTAGELAIIAEKLPEGRREPKEAL